MAAVPLFFYSTYRYGESEARFRHLQEHLQLSRHASEGDHDHAVPPAARQTPGGSIAPAVRPAAVK